MEEKKKIKLEKDTAVNTQGNALFCTIISGLKGRMPFFFESAYFLCVLDENLSVSFLALVFFFFFSLYILMTSVVKLTCSLFFFLGTNV